MADTSPISEFRCPVEVALEVIGGKWKGMILWYLARDTLRFNELLRNMQPITQRVLTKQLRELERDKVIVRKVYAEVPPKVEYSLSEFGVTLSPILDSLQDWGRKYVKQLTEIRKSQHGQ